MLNAPGYCLMCGSPLTVRYLDEEERERAVCDSCGYIHYVNPKIVAGSIPEDGGKIWLLRRGIEPRRGYWTFPAGFMEMGETVEQAAARETMEELSMPVQIGDLLGVYSRAGLHTVHVIYRARALGEPSGGRETLEFALYDPDDIPWDDLAFSSTHDALRDWLRVREASGSA